MLIKRDLLETIYQFIERKEYISITGPRQCGKSTLLVLLRDHISKTYKINNELLPIITFENQKLLAQFEADPVAFVRSYMPVGSNQRCYLFIDEFQYAEDGGKKLKFIYDTVENIKIIITGSSSLDIKARVGKYMVGRIFDFPLSPFTFHECLVATDSRLAQLCQAGSGKLMEFISEGATTQIKNEEDPFNGEFIAAYERYCIWGGYPAAVLAASDLERSKIIAGIYDNYVLKDIKGLLKLATEKNLYLLSQYLATQIGNIVVYQNLGQAAGLDFRKLKKHLILLEETYICALVKPFFLNRQKELSKNPKVFFIDLGFRNNLLENMNLLKKRPDAGAVVENAIFIRLNGLYKGINKINYWRTKAGAEVDFVLHFGEKILPVEIKFSDFKVRKVSKSLASFISAFNPAKALVLTKNYWGITRWQNTDVAFAPIYYL